MSWDSFCQSAKRVVNRAAEKINQSADLATLQVKLSVAEHKLEDAYAELGKAAYLHFTEQENSAEAVAAGMKEVDLAKAAVADLQAQIDKTKEEAAKSDAAAKAEKEAREAEKKAQKEAAGKEDYTDTSDAAEE